MKSYDILFIGALAALMMGIWQDRIDVILYAGALTAFGLVIMGIKEGRP